MGSPRMPAITQRGGQLVAESPVNAANAAMAPTKNSNSARW